jgi:replicative DNA helicase
MTVEFENSLLKAILSKPVILMRNTELLSKEELFSNKYNKFIFTNILEYFQVYKEVPRIEFLKQKIKSEIDNSSQLTIIMDHLEINIEPIQLTESEIDFLEGQIKIKLKDNILTNAMRKIDKLTPDQIENIVEDVSKLNSNEKKYTIKMIWDELESETRQPIPTGLELIDEFGIAKGELGLLIASTGVGKSVFLSFIANNFMKLNYKTLHIVFEGNINTYLSMHRRKLNNPTSEQLKNGTTTNNLRIIQMTSNVSTVKDVENLVKQFIVEGFVPDVLVIDYVDCLVGSNKKEIWQNDISIINELEHLSQKYNVAIWSAVQANRSGVNKDLGLENVAGSISKTQKASMVLSLTRNPIQEDSNKADVKVLKNRFGPKRGSMNCDWNPKEMKIKLPISDSITL